MGLVFGRPNPTWRRIKIGIVVITTYAYLRKWSGEAAPAWVKRLNSLLNSLSPAQIVALTTLVHYVTGHAALLLGLQAPDHAVPYNGAARVC